jgi:hypothetical protein
VQGTVCVLIGLCLCGNGDFRVREKGSKVLYQLVDFSPRTVLDGELGADPEIANRCRLVMNAYFVWHAREFVYLYKPKGWCRWPYYECVWYAPDGSPVWNSWSDETEMKQQERATRHAVRDLIAGRIPVQPVMKELMKYDRQFCEFRGWKVLR